MSQSNPLHHENPDAPSDEESQDGNLSMEQVRKFLLRTKWDLPPSLIDRCSSHYLLQWDTGYFLSLLLEQNTPGVLTASGETYNIVLHRCRMEDIQDQKKVWLSFRKLANYPIAYVLIRPLIYKEPNNESGEPT